MKLPSLAITTVLLFTLAACEDWSRRDRMIAGGVAGAAIGGLTADALSHDDDWIVLGVLAGAAIGTLVARNNATDECAYARGDGRYYVRRCP